MSNPWYDRINGQGTPAMNPYQYPAVPQTNPLQVVGEVANAMRNPMAFAMNAFRDVPPELWNNPAQALQYIQQTRGISDADLRSIVGRNMPGR